MKITSNTNEFKLIRRLGNKGFSTKYIVSNRLLLGATSILQDLKSYIAKGGTSPKSHLMGQGYGSPEINEALKSIGIEGMDKSNRRIAMIEDGTRIKNVHTGKKGIVEDMLDNGKIKVKWDDFTESVNDLSDLELIPEIKAAVVESYSIWSLRKSEDGDEYFVRESNDDGVEKTGKQLSDVTFEEAMELSHDPEAITEANRIMNQVKV